MARRLNRALMNRWPIAVTWGADGEIAAARSTMPPLVARLSVALTMWSVRWDRWRTYGVGCGCRATYLKHRRIIHGCEEHLRADLAKVLRLAEEGTQ